MRELLWEAEHDTPFRGHRDVDDAGARDFVGRADREELPLDEPPLDVLVRIPDDQVVEAAAVEARTAG